MTKLIQNLSKRKMKFKIRIGKILLVLVFHFTLLSCWSRDGLLDTEECSAYRNADIEDYYFNLAMYAGCLNSSRPEKVDSCNIILLLIPGNRSCGEPGIPFPWYKPKKLPGQSN